MVEVTAKTVSPITYSEIGDDDDWDDSRLTNAERDKFLQNVKGYCGRLILFVQSISYIQYVCFKIELESDLRI